VSRRALYRARDIPYYTVVLVLIYLAVIYAPLMYKNLMFKAYIKDTISYPDRYPPVLMRSMIIAEAERRGFVIDSIVIEPKRDEIHAKARWHVKVNHIIDALDHRMDFKIDTSVKFYRE